MLGHKPRDFKQHVAVSLRALVPQDNFYRQADQCIDLSFMRDLAEEFHPSFGRPSIDPVVFFRLQLIAFFEGIRPERQLVETVNLNLAHRWFIGYDLDEPVPDHSSLSLRFKSFTKRECGHATYYYRKEYRYEKTIPALCRDG